MKRYLLITLLLLSGCATSPQECDLHAQDPSFLTKLSCTTSGGYRQRVNEQEQQVLHTQQENELAKQELANTQGRQQASSQQLVTEQAKLSAVQSDLARTLKQLNSRKLKNKQSLQELKHLQSLQQQLQRASSDSEIAAIQRKVDEAKKKVEALEKANTLN